MTFDLVRMGWPNTAAILALAIMPVMALTAPPDRRLAAVQVEQAEPAAMCQTSPACSMVIAAAPETIMK